MGEMRVCACSRGRALYLTDNLCFPPLRRALQLAAGGRFCRYQHSRRSSLSRYFAVLQTVVHHDVSCFSAALALMPDQPGERLHTLIQFVGRGAVVGERDQRHPQVGTGRFLHNLARIRHRTTACLCRSVQHYDDSILLAFHASWLSQRSRAELM